MPAPTVNSSRSGMFPSSSSHPGLQGTMAAKMARMETFSKVKPTCVSLMAIASQSPTPYSQHAKLVDALLSTLSAVPSASLDPAVINYVLFPVTTILRHSNPSTLPDNFLESAFRLLAHTTDAWRGCEGGMDVVAWEQLWKFCTAAVGPRISGRPGSEKGKEREIGQEVQLQAVLLLTALLQPSSSDDSGLPHPTPAMLERVATPKSPLLPTLFQTITLLLETASPSPAHHQLQLASLRLLRPLITIYLFDKPEVLAAVLPGTVSAMAKLVQAGGKGLRGQIAKEAIGLIDDVVVSTLSDEVLRKLGLLRPKVNDLSQLAEEWDSTNDATLPDHPPASSATSAKPTNPFPPLTASYLSFTSAQLLSAIPPILSVMVSHPSDLARHAAIALSSILIETCFEALPMLVPRCLTTLLLLSKDDFDPVRHDAVRRLQRLMVGQMNLDTPILDLLSNAINSLPRLVTSQQDLRVDELARLITAVCDITLGTDGKQKNSIGDLLGPNGGIERWSWALLDCLEFGRPTGWSGTSNIAARAAQLGWEQRPTYSGVPLLLEGGEDEPNARFPHLPLRYIESESTTHAIGEMLSALGTAGGQSALYSVEYLVQFAKANRRRQIAKSVSAIWVAEKLLNGIAKSEAEGLEGRVSKSTRKMAREVVKSLVAMDDDEGEDEDADDPTYDEDPYSEALIPVERTKGIDTLTTLLDRKPISNSNTAAETRRLHNAAQRALLTALSLEATALAARILSSSFRPLLLNSLYVLLSHLASPQQIIREYANIALTQVAYHIGYASPQNMVLDNVDYAINVVSQRLTYRRLSSTAPLVLIAMIRLVGQDLVPLVHDVVDEIFDALDDYHGYEALASSLLAVLVTLIEVMAAEVESQGPSEERLKKVREMRRIEVPPNPQDDLGLFFGWWDEREQRNKESMEEILERAPQHAWGKKDAGEEDDPKGEDKPIPEEGGEPPATRPQEVATRILEKSIYFLTHQSPFLRSKVLSLISHAVPVLAAGNRESDFLPLVDRAWNSILNRLDDKEPYVVTEAAGAIASLCEHAGDFMSKRILDHAWPRMKILVNTQRKLDDKSALTRVRAGGSVGMDKYTISHRLHCSVLQVARFIAREVPVSDSVLWEMMILFRPLLDIRTDQDLQRRAKELYLELGKRDGDAVWVVLSATLGEGDQGCWSHLREEKMDITLNVESVLASI